MSEHRVNLSTPCCGRKVRSATAYHYATEVIDRTCPKCKTSYRLVIEPLLITPDIEARSATWTVK